MNFHKYHALGNAYIVIEGRALSTATVRRICDLNVGIGSDGILLWDGDRSDPFQVHIFNPDGSYAETSGNGLRIFSQFLFDQGLVQHNPFKIQTGNKIVESTILENGLVRVEMGRLTFPAEKFQLTANHQQLTAFPAHIGNPHCVVLCDSPPTPDLAQTLGPHLENHPAFPQRTNVQFMSVRDRANIEIQIWERGAGYTLASGSSSCAAAGIAHRLGLCDEEILVHMSGGVLQVEIFEGFQIVQTGTVTKVASGTFFA